MTLADPMGTVYIVLYEPDVESGSTYVYDVLAVARCPRHMAQDIFKALSERWRAEGHQRVWGIIFRDQPQDWLQNAMAHDFTKVTE